jgi:D-aspartate ligase
MAHTSALGTVALESSASPNEVGAVVIGGDYRGLGIVRSLGRKGIPVWVVTSEHTLATYSRYCARRLRWPTSDDDRISFLIDLGKQLRGWALYPTSDEFAGIIAQHHDELSRYFTMTVAPWEQLEWAYDKRLTYRYAERLGLDVPRTFYPNSYEELANLTNNYPAILKPAFQRGFNRFVHDKGWIAHTKDELCRLYKAACELIDPELIMVQEFIPGGGEAQFSCAALCNEGKTLAVLTARRARQFPLDLGRSSTYVETIQNESVEGHACTLLRAMRYTGLAEVEVKFDARDGKYKLLDVNPRVWGWHTVGSRAGVDFPYLLWRMLYGEPLEPFCRGVAGIRWVRMVTDLEAVVRGILGGSLTFREYFRSLHPPLEFAIFASDDPVPATLEIPLLALLALRRGGL